MVPMMRTLAAAAGLLLLAGCAAGPSESPLAADHPANPNAAVPPLPERSQTLVVTAPVGRPAPDATPAHRHDAGAGHGTGAADGSHRHGTHQHTDGPQPAVTAATLPAAPSAFICPMHPEVVSADPNARCPVCKMKVNKPKPATTPAATAPAAKPGHAGHGGHDGGH